MRATAANPGVECPILRACRAGRNRQSADFKPLIGGVGMGSTFLRVAQGGGFDGAS